MIKDGYITECNLDIDINNCQYFDSKDCSCTGHIKECGMYNWNYCTINRKYVREKRWYEKYYRKGSFYE